MIHSFDFEQTSPDSARLDLDRTDEDFPTILAQLRKLGLKLDEREDADDLPHVFVVYDD